MRSRAEYLEVRSLFAAGTTTAEIVRRTGLPRSTIENWRRRRSPRHERRVAARPEWRPADPAAYAYLLGLYLGDGHLSVVRGSSFLRLALDGQYEGIIERAADAIQAVLPDSRVRRYAIRESGCVVLQASHPVWPYALPQHGRGKKHTRVIALAEWQSELTQRYPEQLIRGLIHSDGCRTVNRFSVDLPVGGRRQYEYARYFFSNLSPDIRDIFVRHCELLGIRCTQSNHRNISISHRQSVALLDSFVGPKRCAMRMEGLEPPRD